MKGGEKKMKSNRRINKFITLVLVTLLTIGLLIVPSIAFADKKQPLGIPVEIDALPSYQYDCCAPYDGYWTVYLAGGTSGPYNVRVSYGDGTSPKNYTASGTHPKHYRFPTWSLYFFHQNWRVYRAGGGGYDYDSTTVETG